jgi:hypothetical protein
MAPLTIVSRRALLAALTAVGVGGIALLPRGVTVDVVDVIPSHWNTDTTPHPEPSIAVNPTNPKMIAVSAYLLGDIAAHGPGYCGPMNGGLLMSNDGGSSWSMGCVLPKPPHRKIGDLSIDYSGDGNLLLASYFGGIDALQITELRRFVVEGIARSFSANVTSSTGPDLDQPFVVAVPGSASHSYTVGVRDVSPSCPAGGWIRWWITSGASGSTCVAVRPAEGLINVRTAHASDGGVYGLFFTTRNDAVLTSDLVLVRGRLPSAPPLTASFDELHDTMLLDRDAAAGSPCSVPDGTLGQRLKNCARVPIDNWDDSRSQGCGPGVGSQVRNPDQVAIAVDPDDPHTVFYAYGDSTPGHAFTLHLMRWSDAGGSQTNREVRPPVYDALNPAVVMTATGRIGFAYQQLSGGLWQTRLQVSARDRSSWQSVTLSGPASNGDPPANCDLTSPYLGDYMDIASVGDTIYGTFSFTNNPAANPNARYLRDPSMLGPTGVHYAIDPFFYKVSFDRPLYAIVGPSFNRTWSRAVARLKAMLETRAAIPQPPDSAPPPPSAPRTRGPG